MPDYINGQIINGNPVIESQVTSHNANIPGQGPSASDWYTTLKYRLDNEVTYTIAFAYNASNYVYTVTLLNHAGTVIDTKTFDSGNGKNVSNVALNYSAKKIVVTTNDGTVINCDITALIDRIENHIAATNNPHNVSKAQVGLGNVDNTADANKPLSGPQKTYVDAEITEEAGARYAADEVLQENIDAEELARQNADSSLQSEIDAEEIARANADNTLQGNIDAETLARSSADTNLQTNITNEASARQNADTNLQTNITNEATTRANADTNLQTNITNEATTRANADTNLQNAINQKSHVEAKQSGTSTTEAKYIIIDGVEYKLAAGGTMDFEVLEHRPKYNGVTMDRNTNIPEVKTDVWDAKANQSDLDAEELARQGADTTLQGNIDAEATTRGNADATLAADDRYTNANGTTVAVGGIAKGTTFNNKKLKDIIEDIFYPYVAFSFGSIGTTPGAGTFEYGTTKTITKVKPNYTAGSKSINYIKIGTASGGKDLYEGNSAASGVDITLTTSYAWDGKTNKTIYCTISDGTTTAEKTATFNAAYYTYYKVTNSTTAPTSGATKTSSTGSGDSTIATQDNTYIWFLTRTSKTKIQQYVTGQWNDMTTTSAGTVTLTLASGETATYYAYRTDKMVAASSRYQIV